MTASRHSIRPGTIPPAGKAFGPGPRRRPERVNSLLLGIDVGSTVVKAVLFDLGGRTLASGAQMVPVQRPRPGWVERDADQVWRAVSTTIGQAVREPARIVAVGITGCGNGAVFVDEALRPLRAGVLSSDQRAERYLVKSPRDPFAAYPGQTAPLLRWFRAEEADRAELLAHALPWKDFVRARLTGKVVTDPTDAGAAGWLAPGTRRIADTFRSDPAVPPVQESLVSAGEITVSAARETGLSVGTPVFTGCLDCEAAAIGSGATEDGTVSLVAGTWSINQRFVLRRPKRRDWFLVNPSVQPGRWLVLEGSPTSAANLEWAMRLLHVNEAVEALRRVESTRRTRALFVPRAPTGAGVFAGIDASHGPGELLRAVVEGIAFSHRAHVAKLLGQRRRPHCVRLAGGLARSAVGAQLFADVLGCTVEVPATEENGALGAALCAGVGAGVWSSLEAAQHDAVRVARTFAPEAARQAEFEQDFLRYQRLAAQMSSS